MSEETAATSTPEATAPAPETTSQPETTPESQPEPQSNGKPEGFEPVEFTPEQKSRIDRLYGNMKRYESESREYRQANELLIQQLQQVQQGQQQIVSHLQNSDFAETETQLAGQAKAALDRGDIDNFLSIQGKLTDARVRKGINDATSKKAPASQQQVRMPPQGPVSAQDAINMAVDSGDVTPDEANVYRAWVGQTDENGNILRPWTSQGDIRNSAAAIEGRAVFSNPAFADKPFAEKLKEIDRRMGIRTMQNTQSVLPAGNLTRGQKTTNVKITPYEERVAVMTKFGGSKAKTDADHINAWRQAKIKHSGGR